MAAWVAHWVCNFGAQRGDLVVRGSIPGSGAEHFSLLSVLSSATFAPFPTQTPRPNHVILYGKVKVKSKMC